MIETEDIIKESYMKEYNTMDKTITVLKTLPEPYLRRVLEAIEGTPPRPDVKPNLPLIHPPHYM